MGIPSEVGRGDEDWSVLNPRVVSPRQERTLDTHPCRGIKGSFVGLLSSTQGTRDDEDPSVLSGGTYHGFVISSGMRIL